METPVDGLCHLLADELDKRLSGQVIGLVHEGDNIWHYALRLPDGRVMDKHGTHESVDAFLEKASEAWPEASFEVEETEIERESVEIFSEKERMMASGFAKELIDGEL